MKLTVINGPNLNMLGQRPASIYGSATLQELVEGLEKTVKAAKWDFTSYQSNIEGELVDALQKANKESAGIILNAGAYSHTSLAIRDAIESLSIPVVEVHLSNIHAREPFRHHSYVSEVAAGVIVGLGAYGYQLAFKAIQEIVKTYGKV